MSFLAGYSPIALAAALTVPPLVLFYFLKLRRQPITVSSTLLWKRAVEDLQVNAPFQRIRNNLLLWLQLLVLLLAAFALGQPVLEALQREEDTVVVLIDQSASMNAVERDGDTRLDEARRQAQAVIDNLPDGSRAMVIGFSDRATVISSFDTDKQQLKRKIDAVDATESVTTLSEALTLAEAYMQNLVIAGDTAGADIEVRGSSRQARVVILTDGNVADADALAVKRLPSSEIEVIRIGERCDNVAILAMDARRNYETPALVDVFTRLQNFGDQPVHLRASLYIDGVFRADFESRDGLLISLAAGRAPRALDGATGRGDGDTHDGETSDGETSGGESSGGASGDDGSGDGDAAPVASRTAAAGPLPGSEASLVLKDIRHDGAGHLEVRINVEDALAADNRAHVILPPPRRVQVLLVGDGSRFLSLALKIMPLELTTMTPAAYESADGDDLALGGRSLYDVVIMENHSTQRLFTGNYLFLGGIPQIDGVSAEGYVGDEVIFNWDETHPVLRYVPVQTIEVFRWLRMRLPAHAELLMEGESSPVMAYLRQAGSGYLIGGFGLTTEDEVTGQPLLNTRWVNQPHFLVFLQNAIQFLSGSLSPTAQRNHRPGQPLTFPVPPDIEEVRVRRPDGSVQRVPTAGMADVSYARTRLVGVYSATPAIDERGRQAVNLFSAAESDVAPREKLVLAGTTVQSAAGVQRVNRPFWPYVLLAMLAVMALEWAVYSKRVFV